MAFTDNNNERLVGDAAKNQATINPQNTIFGVKRLIGRDYSDKSVQADKKLVPYEIVSNNNKPNIRVNDNMYAPEEISAMVLRKMKETAETYLGKEVKRAVVTVPGEHKCMVLCRVVLLNLLTDISATNKFWSPPPLLLLLLLRHHYSIQRILMVRSAAQRRLQVPLQVLKWNASSMNRLLQH